MTSFKALGNVVLVLPDEVDEERGGIYIPTTALEVPTRGVVASAGPDAPGLTVGDRVEFMASGSVTVVLDSQAYLAMPYNSVLGVVSDEPWPDVEE